MNVYFHTNLDLTFPEQWPTLNHAPQIGSNIESKSGLSLKVVSISYDYNSDVNVELHLGSAWHGRSIADFNKWDKDRPRRSRG